MSNEKIKTVVEDAKKLAKDSKAVVEDGVDKVKDSAEAGKKKAVGFFGRIKAFFVGVITKIKKIIAVLKGKA